MYGLPLCLNYLQCETQDQWVISSIFIDEVSEVFSAGIGEEEQDIMLDLRKNYGVPLRVRKMMMMIQ